MQLDKFNYQDDWSGLAPCVCIPTPTGTGSEVGRSSVITLSATKRKAGLYRRVGLACDLDVVKATASEADQATIRVIRQFIIDLGLGMGLREYGVTETLLDDLTEQAFEDPCHRTNPVPVTAADLRGLYLAAL